MEIKNIYIAKDGREFEDPIKCSEYEERIGFIPGTVGMLLKDLEKINRNAYISGIAITRDKKKESRVYLRGTFNCDHVLCSYVNVENLSEEQRYYYSTVDEFVDTLRKEEDKDSNVQYMLAYSENLNFCPVSIIANYCADVWKKE